MYQVWGQSVKPVTVLELNQRAIFSSYPIILRRVIGCSTRDNLLFLNPNISRMNGYIVCFVHAL